MSPIVAMVELEHFSHHHPLNIVHLQPNHNSEEEEEEEDNHVDDFVAEEHHVGQCNMCKEDIFSFHLCYYRCKDCNYCLHRFCAELPTTLQDHPLHPNHTLTLSEKFQFSHPSFKFGSDHEWTCGVCNRKKKNFFNYHCSNCTFNMDIICATISQQKIDHPSHPHQLQRNPKKLVSDCNACGREHEGTFYQCTICCWFSVHQDCALSPSKLLIQHPTDGSFTHSHPLTLAYSFPFIDQETKFYPRCRICNKGLFIYFWHYKCDKCRYYVHIHCATAKYVDFLSPGRGKISKNYEDDDHPNLLHCPFPDESYNLIRHQVSDQKGLNIVEDNSSGMPVSLLHEHPLILIDTQTLLVNTSILLHDPMKKIQLLCDGCVKPITQMPFYKCAEDFRHCVFVLHEWCARLPSEIKHHPGHPHHTLFLVPKITTKLFRVIMCNVCTLPSNSFAYGCTDCDYYVDINCAFLPKEITHEAHPRHLLTKIVGSSSQSETPCNACGYALSDCFVFHCSSCDFYLHSECALLLPKMIRHKHDKHPLSQRYEPVENHPGDYFCEICEEEFNPAGSWFYHCEICVQSMHSGCAPVILQCEQAPNKYYRKYVFKYINVKFGGTIYIKSHPHRLSFVQGMTCHGKCKKCKKKLQYWMIFKCLECDYVLHYYCATIIDVWFFRLKLRRLKRVYQFLIREPGLPSLMM